MDGEIAALPFSPADVLGNLGRYRKEATCYSNPPRRFLNLPRFCLGFLLRGPFEFFELLTSKVIDPPHSLLLAMLSRLVAPGWDTNVSKGGLRK